MSDRNQQTGLGDYSDGTKPTSDDLGGNTDGLGNPTADPFDITVHYAPDEAEPPTVSRGVEGHGELFVEDGPDRGNHAGSICTVIGPDGPGTDPHRPAIAIVRTAERSKHRVRKVNGYGMNTAAMTRAIRQGGAKLVLVADTETGHVYEWPITLFRRDLGDVIDPTEPQKYGSIADSTVWHDRASTLFAPRGEDGDGENEGGGDGFKRGSDYR